MEADEGGGANFIDSAPLNGSNTNNGTRGFTAAPDLQFVQIRASQNQIAYVFDQEVIDPVNDLNTASAECTAVGDPPGCGSFKYIDQAGDEHFSIGASVASFPGDGRERVVVAQFDDGSFNPVLGDDDVTDAVIAVAEQNAVEARTTDGSNGDEDADNEEFSVTVPGTSGDTNDPDLVSTELVNGGDSDLMLFTYNGQIDPQIDDNCYAITSISTQAVAENILVTGPNTLQVEFHESFSNISERIVGGGDHGGCVTDANTDEESTQGAKPAGGNVGAQATGYVEAPTRRR